MLRGPTLIYGALQGAVYSLATLLMKESCRNSVGSDYSDRQWQCRWALGVPGAPAWEYSNLRFEI